MPFPPFFSGLPFTARQAGKKLSWLLAGGEIRQVLTGVYVATDVPDTCELRAAAAELVMPADAVACGETAAWIHGIPTMALSPADNVPLRWKNNSTDVVEVAGVKVTSPLATGVDLALHLPRPFALSAVDALLRSGRAQRADLEAALDDYAGHGGVPQARQIFKYADRRAESPGESWLRLRLIDAGFGRPELQVRVDAAGREYRVDVGYLEPVDGRRLGLEYDSDRWHSRDRQKARDEKRRTELARVGWHIISVQRTDVWGAYPALELAVGGFLCKWPRLPRRW